MKINRFTQYIQPNIYDGRICIRLAFGDWEAEKEAYKIQNVSWEIFNMTTPFVELVK